MDKKTLIAIIIGVAVTAIVIYLAILNADPFRDMDEKQLEDGLRYMDNLNQRTDGRLFNNNAAR